MRVPAIVASVLGAGYARLGQEAVAELRRSLQPDLKALRE
jgi:hypothetical protein